MLVIIAIIMNPYEILILEGFLCTRKVPSILLASATNFCPNSIGKMLTRANSSTNPSITLGILTPFYDCFSIKTFQPIYIKYLHREWASRSTIEYISLQLHGFVRNQRASYPITWFKASFSLPASSWQPLSKKKAISWAAERCTSAARLAQNAELADNLMAIEQTKMYEGLGK